MVEKEKQEITQQTIGFSWHFSVEREDVKPVEGSRASAKIVTKASLNGNADTFTDAVITLTKAKKQVNTVLNEA